MNLQSLFRGLFFLPGAVGEAGPLHGNPGGSDAQFALGRRHDEASAPDFQQAMEWYRKAADQGHAAAQLNLGRMYESGRGVARDEAEALNWMRKSADGGNAAAQHHLGVRCHRLSLRARHAESGEHRIEAYKWLHLAAGQGHLGSAAACERVTISMSRDEVFEGNQRVNSFVPRGAETVKGPPDGARE